MVEEKIIRGKELKENFLKEGKKMSHGFSLLSMHSLFYAIIISFQLLFCFLHDFLVCFP